MTNVAMMSIYGGTRQKLVLSGFKWQMTSQLGIHPLGLIYYQICSNDDHRLSFDILTQVSESGTHCSLV